MSQLTMFLHNYFTSNCNKTSFEFIVRVFKNIEVLLQNKHLVNTYKLGTIRRDDDIGHR